MDAKCRQCQNNARMCCTKQCQGWYVTELCWCNNSAANSINPINSRHHLQPNYRERNVTRRSSKVVKCTDQPHYWAQ